VLHHRLRVHLAERIQDQPRDAVGSPRVKNVQQLMEHGVMMRMYVLMSVKIHVDEISRHQRLPQTAQDEL
jgi:hypothetical protein